MSKCPRRAKALLAMTRPGVDALTAKGRTAAADLFFFAEAVADQSGEGVDGFLRLRAQGRDSDCGALASTQSQNAHDGRAAHSLGATRDGDIRVEQVNTLHKLRSRAGVQALFINDGQFARNRTLTHGSRGAIFLLDAIHHDFPAKTRLATLMYLRPASCACTTA